MYVYNPDAFEPKHYLPTHLHSFADCARVLVHLVETARVFNKLHDSDFVPRKAAYLRRTVHKEMYLPIRDALLSASILEMDPQYFIGKKSCGFRLGERFKDALFRRYKLSDKAAIRRLQNVRNEQCPALTDNTLKGLQAWLNKLEVDYEAAWTFLRALALPSETIRQRHISLAMLRDRELFFKPDMHGRVHTNLTNLWSGFRQFLRFDGECLVNIDIGNSQPLFFGLVVLNWIRSGRQEEECKYSDFLSPFSSSPFHYDAESISTSVSDSIGSSFPDDLRHYLHLTEEARFYEHMMTALAIPINRHSRDAFKGDFFGKVFYCKPTYYTKERKAFLAEFPTVLENITRLKKDDPRNAPLALQRAESEFVIGTVCKRILKDSPSTPIWTIHDSIMTTASKGDFVSQVMQEEFARLGVHPRLRVEGLIQEPMVDSQLQPEFGRPGIHLRPRSEAQAQEPALRSRLQPEPVIVVLTEIGSGLLAGDPPTVPLHPRSGRPQTLVPAG